MISYHHQQHNPLTQLPNGSQPGLVPDLIPFDSSHFIELSSEALGASILSVSDEWFAPARSLLNPAPPSDLSGQFGPNGALYDGWETRRHNQANDWAIIQLGVPSGSIEAFEIDTGFFNGNEAPNCSIDALVDEGLDPAAVDPPTSPDDPRWCQILPMVSLGPASRHFFKVPKSNRTGYRYVKLNMIPDGGIARLRVYGNPIPVFPGEGDSSRFDLASILFGAKVVFTSDQHYGVGSNLILPGRGPKNMDGGWETKRSRKPGHSDFVIIKLADKGFLDYTEIDTNYFIGNYPQYADLYATVSDDIIPDANSKWTEILAKTKLGPHQQQYFELSKPRESFTHVRLTIYPDGGVKRVRLFGRRTPEPVEDQKPWLTATSQVGFSAEVSRPLSASKLARRVPILPLTRAGFEAYGSVIQSDLDSRANPHEPRPKLVNFGTALKFDRVAPRVGTSHPLGTPNLCLFSCQPWEPNKNRSDPSSSSPMKQLKLSWNLKGLERHQFSSQTFIPLATHLATADPADQSEFKSRPDGEYVIVVALDDGGKPKMETIRAFLGRKSQGISYFENVWHAPLIAIRNRMEFGCLVYETGDPKLDCEVVEVDDVVCELDPFQVA